MKCCGLHLTPATELQHCSESSLCNRWESMVWNNRFSWSFSWQPTEKYGRMNLFPRKHLLTIWGLKTDKNPEANDEFITKNQLTIRNRWPKDVRNRVALRCQEDGRGQRCLVNQFLHLSGEVVSASSLVSHTLLCNVSSTYAPRSQNLYRTSLQRIQRT